ncbi:MAG: hypothetical protein COT92_03795 [Candidatus Doudnabacteria bacterium CG10_big_fil_rev_8_21_14_0_10_42_18]|uniref:Sortase n=1 Tax=Candidatus Doudnabacteria bacterium CG10_big_fil_rev_8_21_14_0_10_42_18 TaxID=1974552 RepID=A0A2H0VC57_9BACT|nr:MAG: hypothetical protein COT92_03795 [Candidatus Doudnabacteria bacterium CG10_big_fil_rev_8_21_14_0_10_42_18]
MRKRYKILIALGAILVLFLLLNFPYFWLQAKNLLFGPPQVQHQNSSDAGELIEPDILIIESLGIRAPIVYADEKMEEAFQSALANGVVHYPHTALPGEEGNVYIFGHSSDYVWSKGDYKTVFALLPEAEIGKKIIISNSQGKAFTYIVTDKFAAAADDVHLLSQETNGKRILTLQTSYPIGTALKRYIVIAKLLE